MTFRSIVAAPDFLSASFLIRHFYALTSGVVIVLGFECVARCWRKFIYLPAVFAPIHGLCDKEVLQQQVVKLAVYGLLL